MGKKSGVHNRLAREHLFERFGRWWEVNNIDVLTSMLEEVNGLSTKNKTEQKIKVGMYFRIVSRLSLFSKTEND